MKRFFGFILIMLLFSGCETDNEPWDCSTGPVGFTFEVVDKVTGENLFTAGLYEESQISIKNEAGESVEFDFIEENNRNFINVLLGWEIKTDTYQITIGDEIDFGIYFELDRRGNEHCTNIVLTELQIEGIAFKKDETTGVTQILAETGEGN